MFDDFGVLFTPFGDKKYLDEACYAAESVKRHMPQLSIGCVTDQVVSCDLFDMTIPLPDDTDDARFDSIAAAFYKKIKCLSLSPFKKTLFLDTDTYCCHPMWDMLSALLHSEMVAVHAPARTNVDWSSEENILEYLQSRPYVPHINTGVLAYRQCPEILAFFKLWEQIFETHYRPVKNFNDQSIFQEAVAQAKLKCMFLPVEYNLRISKPSTVSGPVRILHGRHKRYKAENVERLFNSYLGERTILGSIGMIYISEGGVVFRTGFEKIKTYRFESYMEFRHFLIEKGSEGDHVDV
jgi:hypothetical protein